MRILFLSRATLFTNAGGDTIQMKKTAEELSKLGVEVEIRLTSDEVDYGDYDLIHFFNIIRPADILHHLRRSAKPYVVSTIYVDYADYERANSQGIRKIIFNFLSGDQIEYLKAIGRLLINKERIRSLYYLFNGHKRSVKKVISQASLLLPNSHSEYERLKTRYKLLKPYRVIPNGIDTCLFNQRENTFSDRKIVLCVARIEPLKNQLNLIKGLRKSQYDLVIIGRASINHQHYYQECKKAATVSVRFIDYLPQRELIQFYSMAKVHVLPSWFETTGLSSLEAAAMGCNVVITDKGDTREYFKNYAYYCEPASPASILDAVQRAMEEPINAELAAMVKREYTWQIAAQETLEAYKEIVVDSAFNSAESGS
jgi:glycosyltransferase involved in cell wall biosynthesis